MIYRIEDCTKKAFNTPQSGLTTSLIIKQSSNLGATLIETIVILGLISLLLSFGLDFNALIENNKSSSAINSFVDAISLVRQTAIYTRLPVVLCPRAQDKDGEPICGTHEDWVKGLLVFIDNNDNAILNKEERILKVFSSFPQKSKIYWRSFRNKAYLTMKYGFTDWQNGHILYCPPNGDLKYARKITINVAGRVRLHEDTDGDGIVESQGKNISCPS